MRPPRRETSGNEPLTKALELNEDVLRQDPHTGLGELAQGTGGLIFDNTNNLRTGFDRVESDLRNYYLIGYTPTNSTYDGTFRKIEVKVNRPGLTVAARKGYFAVRDTGGAPVNTWEAPALAALDRRPVPNAFPYRVGALQFPSNEKPGPCPRRCRSENGADLVSDHRGSESLQVRLCRDRSLRRRPEQGRAEGEPALRDERRARQAGSGEEQRCDLLPRAGARAGRLHDGDDCLRQADRQGERPLCHGRSAESRPGEAPDEQPCHRQAQ